jgi:hypothetical protein
MPNKEVDRFDLDNNAINNYINLSIEHMKTFHFYKNKNDFPGALNALESLILDLPPKGKQFLEAERTLIRKTLNDEFIENHYGRKIRPLQWMKDLSPIYEKTIDWIYPNLLELRMNVGKPAYTTEAHLGNGPSNKKPA